MPSRTQITRHDCVEGWSAIAKWKGVPLAEIIHACSAHAEAKYVVFHCMDTDDSGANYYESIDFVDATSSPNDLSLRDERSRPANRTWRPAAPQNRKRNSATNTPNTSARSSSSSTYDKDRFQVKAATGKIKATEWYAGISNF